MEYAEQVIRHSERECTPPLYIQELGPDPAYGEPE